jgi:hypothetical protein
MSPPFEHPAHRRLWEYWQTARTGRRALPSRELDLSVLGPVADYLLQVERIEGRFRYVMVGAVIQRIYGYPMEGIYLDLALPPNRREPAIERYALVCDTGTPILTRNAYEISASLSFAVDRLFVPLAGTDGAVSGVLCAQVLRNSQDGALGPATRLQPDGGTLVFLDADTAASRIAGSQRG